MESVPPINRILSHGHWTMGFMDGSWSEGQKIYDRGTLALALMLLLDATVGNLLLQEFSALTKCITKAFCVAWYVMTWPGICRDQDVGRFWWDTIWLWHSQFAMEKNAFLSSVNLYFYGPFPMAILNSQRVFKTFKVLTQHLGCTKTADVLPFEAARNRMWIRTSWGYAQTGGLTMKRM